MKEESIEKIKKILDEIMLLTFEKSRDGDELLYKINTLAHDCKKHLPASINN